ncbi:MAG: sugar ABC transporter ATP-binding protein [Chloroflexota bacterium]|nr:sugar ABC transporter ATP-binding protein [Chloroflexota bacterium]
MGERPPLLEARAVSKSYGSNRVLSDVNFSLLGGQSVAVIGENGAGKSTFAKILTGVIRPDSGTLLLNGKRVAFSSPREALVQGIAFIPQELAYVPHLTVAENILLGRWPSWRGLTTHRAALGQAQAECEQFGIAMDVRRPMIALKLADRQIVEIVKALARRARLIVLDEPTASLSDHESRVLFEILGRLARDGVGVIYISHRMDEVYRFSDRVDVFRNGELVASVPPSRTTPAQLIGYMLGVEREEQAHTTRHAQSRVSALAEIRGWSRPGLPPLSQVSLTIAEREVVGLYGLRGSGTDLVAEGLAGLRPDITGELRLADYRGRPFATPVIARRAGVSYVPAERKRDGLVLPLSIEANLSLLILGRLSRLGTIRRRLERSHAAELARQFDVRYRRLGQRVAQLSGGNQQKVLLASRVATSPKLLVLQEPTRGVDVGARVEIHKFLGTIADRGCGVLLVTSDLEEAVVVSDRLLVMREGRIVGELTGASRTQANAIALAAGGAPAPEISA